MKGHGEKLSRNQERAIATLLIHPTMLAAAAAAGVSLENLLRRHIGFEFIDTCVIPTSD